jgi:hypothetical protein
MAQHDEPVGIAAEPVRLEPCAMFTPSADGMVCSACGWLDDDHGAPTPVAGPVTGLARPRRPEVRVPERRAS